MSAVCIQERVIQAVEDKLNELVAAGVASEEVIRPTRGGKTPPHKNGQMILIQEDPIEDPRPPAGFSQWLQPVGVDLVVISSDSDTTPVDTLVNEFRAQVEKKLRQDPQFKTTDISGAVVDTVVHAPMSFDPAVRVDGCRVYAHVVFRHRRDDPYSFT